MTKDPYPAELVTVALGGAALSSFVQPRPFYTAQKIDVLKPKKEMSLDEKLYYCLVTVHGVERWKSKAFLDPRAKLGRFGTRFRHLTHEKSLKIAV